MIEIGGFVSLLVIGFLFGRFAERRHLKRIIDREQRFVSLPAVASRFPPEDQAYDQMLVSGSVVIASDYFKTFMAGLINIFGGRVTPFESMLDRARRESMLRMKTAAQAAGGTLVFNVKYNTSTISLGSRSAAMEVLVYGTAMIPRQATAAAGDGLKLQAY